MRQPGLVGDEEHGPGPVVIGASPDAVRWRVPRPPAGPGRSGTRRRRGRSARAPVLDTRWRQRRVGPKLVSGRPQRSSNLGEVGAIHLIPPSRFPTRLHLRSATRAIIDPAMVAGSSVTPAAVRPCDPIGALMAEELGEEIDRLGGDRPVSSRREVAKAFCDTSVSAARSNRRTSRASLSRTRSLPSTRSEIL